ncbi:addiction module protein [Stratiformator vulcanicus]|uniref:Addiction module component n=1 Tax=Stratiformator vulcanicus TaxID=2527980 RepID=A0A517R5E3_9PLAN|nr:addiction module protein [Stratiformator vulcanicus]QDT39104.1 Putative addiction module component [Stratiformator vulcanicus]
MSTNASDELIEKVFELPEEQRAALAARLLDSLGDEPAEEVREAWRTEIAERLERYHNGETKAVPLEEAWPRIL